ncbi:acyltransferase family protein [Sinomonas humi]|uniref:acyltransferase family protein n=1 Tax=Sinomonas humi TaxID=1338436 RepID=UPI00068A54BD|nr:acyltransferase family protein [Sinomonas humi]
MSRGGASQRSDIQGLRALAVSLVVVYHLRPSVLPGGFIGVDVFFVISGFLIIGSLVREAARDQTVDIVTFYSRRIRRLVPAAAVVLLAVVAATVVLLPGSRWQAVSSDVLFSLLQVQNWHQAFSSTSYAGATAAVSPIQHFWSLAVEEQFYLLVPVLLWVVLRLSSRRPDRSIAGRAVLVLALIASASLVYSVFLSNAAHTLAYFATTTRLWELAVGGLAALVPQTALEQISGWSALATWTGFAAIVIAARTLSTDMAFPGYIALVPVLGTVLLLRSGDGARLHNRWSAGRILSWKPIVFVGDVSYSLYLWHWPLVVFTVAILGRELRIREAIVLATLSLALAAVSYYLIEERFRRPRPESRSGRSRTMGSYRIAAVTSLVVALTAWGPWQVIEGKRAELQAGLSNQDYPGAMAWGSNPRPVSSGLPARPDPAVAAQDVPVTYTTDCGVYDPEKTPDDQCWYGAPRESSAPTVAIVGDSHAGQYVDSLVEISKRVPLKIHAMVRNGCPFSTTPPRSGTTSFANCSDQNKVTLQRLLRDRPDLVLLAGMTSSGYKNALGWTWDASQPLTSGYVDALTTLGKAGIRVHVLADNPFPPSSPAECLQRAGAGESSCSFPDQRPEDDLVSAARQVDGVNVLDLHPYFCRNGTCPAVIGNIVVYRDNHMTATFAKSLAGLLADHLGVVS